MLKSRIVDKFLQDIHILSFASSLIISNVTYKYKQGGDGSFDQWGNKSAPFGLCISELYETRGAKQGVPYGPYGFSEVLIFTQKNSGKFKFLFFIYK